MNRTRGDSLCKLGTVWEELGLREEDILTYLMSYINTWMSLYIEGCWCEIEIWKAQAFRKEGV